MWKHTASWNPKHLNEKHNQSRSANISHDSHDAILLNEFADLWSDAEKLWDQHQESPGFHAYVSADYSAIFTALQQLRNSAVTVLEWGSGLGIATIMASRMGFEAYGIEAEQELLEHSDRLANAYGSTATFAQGSFVPDEFRHQSETHHEQKKTIIDLADAYVKLGLKTSLLLSGIKKNSSMKLSAATIKTYRSIMWNVMNTRHSIMAGVFI